MTDSDRSVETLLAQGGHFIDPATGAIVPPIHPATTFARDEHYELRGYGYSRSGNPTCALVEQVLAELEGAADALVFASGLAGVATFFDTVHAGARVVVPRVMYHGAADWLRRRAERREIDLVFFDAGAPDGLEAAVAAGDTAVVWIEASVNPTWDVIDVRAAAEMAHAAGAVLGVDATATPAVTLRALDLGADIVFHSGTKYLAGHSDLTAGVLATPIRRRTLGGREARAHAHGRRARGVRSLAPAARHAYAARPLRAPGGERDRDRPALRGSSEARSGALPGTRFSSRTRHCEASDDQRIRRHALHSRRGRRERGEARRDPHPAVRARDLARRGSRA